jgi:hypothetical protein
MGCRRFLTPLSANAPARQHGYRLLALATLDSAESVGRDVLKVLRAARGRSRGAPKESLRK